MCFPNSLLGIEIHFKIGKRPFGSYSFFTTLDLREIFNCKCGWLGVVAFNKLMQRLAVNNYKIDYSLSVSMHLTAEFY